MTVALSIPEALLYAREEEVERMQQEDVIEQSTSLWSSPSVVVPMPVGTFCLCNDFGRLDQISVFPQSGGPHGASGEGLVHLHP